MSFSTILGESLIELQENLDQLKAEVISSRNTYTKTDYDDDEGVIQEEKDLIKALAEYNRKNKQITRRVEKKSPKNRCTHVFMRGGRKGDQCTNMTIAPHDKCGICRNLKVRKQCCHVFSRGKNAGKQCTVKTQNSSGMCAKCTNITRQNHLEREVAQEKKNNREAELELQKHFAEEEDASNGDNSEDNSDSNEYEKDIKAEKLNLLISNKIIYKNSHEDNSLSDIEEEIVVEKNKKVQINDDDDNSDNE